MARKNIHIEIDEKVLSQVEAFGRLRELELSELFEFFARRCMRSMSIDEPDETVAEVLDRHHFDLACKAAMRGDLVPEEEIEAERAEMLADIRRRRGLME